MKRMSVFSAVLALIVVVGSASTVSAASGERKIRQRPATVLIYTNEAFAQVKARGNYSWGCGCSDSQVPQEHFDFTALDRKSYDSEIPYSIDVVLLKFEGYGKIGSGKIVSEMARLGLESAGMRELLAYGVQHLDDLRVDAAPFLRWEEKIVELRDVALFGPYGFSWVAAIRYDAYGSKCIVTTTYEKKWDDDSFPNWFIAVPAGLSFPRH